MTQFFVSEETRIQVRQILHFKGDVKKHSIDFSPWADDNGEVTGVTWSIESGQAALSSETLVDNIAQVTITTSESGYSSVKAIATDGTHSEAVYIKLRCKDPQVIRAIDDYGLVKC